MCPENSDWMLRRVELLPEHSEMEIDSRFAQRSPVPLLIRLRQSSQVGIGSLKQYATDCDLVLFDRVSVETRSALSRKTYRSQSTRSRVMQCLTVLLNSRVVYVGVLIPCTRQCHDKHSTGKVYISYRLQSTSS